MKKTLIAGAASVALAAMPVVGVFAEGQQVDTIKVGISESCTIALAAANGHTNGTDTVSGTWGVESAANTLTGSVANGSASNNFGSTKLTISCNKSSGFNVAATATALTAATVTEPGTSNKVTIPLNASFSGSASGWAYKVENEGLSAGITNNTSSWSATASNASLVSGTAPINNGSFTVTYGVGVDTTQPADTYTGTITYTISPAA